MLLGYGEKSSYVCSAKLSKSLPLWSNAKHCAECPPLGTQAFDAIEHFGLMDGTAAAYFDFWSEKRTLNGYVHEELYQSMHDLNGVFSESCSKSRATDANGHAGQ